MKISKLMSLLLALCLVLMSLPSFVSAEDNHLSVAIVQLVSHPSLDQIHEGVIEGLADQGYKEGENLDINFQNAEGDMNLLTTISQQVTSQKPDLIFAITTPVAQALQNATSDIPIILAGITDPEAANLIDSLEKPGANISGISDQIPMEEQFKLIKTMVPDAKKVGMIYSSSEDNSKAEIEKAQKAAEGQGFEVQVQAISSALDMQTVAEKLANETDLIFIGSDNTIASAFESLISVTDRAKKPIFSPVELMIESGAVAGTAIKQKDIGLKSAEFAGKVLGGQEIGQLPIEYIEDYKVLVNEDSLKLLGLKVPGEIKVQVTSVAGE